MLNIYDSAQSISMSLQLLGKHLESQAYNKKDWFEEFFGEKLEKIDLNDRSGHE